MKRLLSFILTAVMLVSLFPVAVSASRFDDVDDGKWYTEAIEFCDMNGYMAGTSENVFERNGTLTRAMFVTVLASIEGINTNYYAYNPCFSDVALGKWYSGAIAWAYAKGLASGLGDGTFGYKDPVTREQIAVFMLAYAEYLNSFNGEAIDTSINADLSVYSDCDRVHSWASEAMSWAVAAGIISGTSNTTLDPRGNCTRAQAAVIIQNFVLNVDKSCDHIWVDASCVKQSYCVNCFLLKDDFTAHDYKGGKCTVCETKLFAGDLCGHVWYKDSCDTDSRCIRCGNTKDDAGEHNYTSSESGTPWLICSDCGYWTCAGDHVWVEPTCVEQGYCNVCYDPGDPPTGHKLDSDGVCRNCSGFYDEEDRCFHVWRMPDCENDGFCIICDKPGEKSDGHEIEDGECIYCGYVPCNHNWADPTCTKPAHCTVCGETDDSKPAIGHDYNVVYTCRNCHVTKKPYYTAHQNVMENVTSRGKKITADKKGFQETYLLTTSIVNNTLYMINGDYENVYVSTLGTDLQDKISVVIKLSESMTECPFTFKYEESGKTTYLIEGTAALENGEITVTVADTIGKYAYEEMMTSVTLMLTSTVLYAESMLSEYCDVSLTDYGFEIGLVPVS